jgi:uncharacterized protein (DUF433 family)|tara:strand:- start:10366 stop:10581 length:216 start_codon:yes stop_codon:yes gene_type:complete
MNYSDYIKVDPEIRFGRPCLTGTRIAVYEILTLVSNGETNEQIIRDYPDLNENSIEACFAFAKEHKPKLSA